EWAAVVNRDGMVCAIVFSGTKRGDQWPGSRVIAASKASTANALSGANYALSTANLYAAAQPGGSLYGLANSAPPNPQAVFGNPSSFGTSSDPMVGKAIGGVVVFGGGLALYSSRGNIVGGLGLSGDTACTDHVIAWKVRHQLQLDAVPMGPSPAHNDNMISIGRRTIAQADSDIRRAKGEHRRTTLSTAFRSNSQQARAGSNRGWFNLRNGASSERRIRQTGLDLWAGWYGAAQYRNVP